MFEKMIVNLAKDYMKRHEVKIKDVSLGDLLVIRFDGEHKVLQEMFEYLTEFKKEVENE